MLQQLHSELYDVQLRWHHDDENLELIIQPAMARFLGKKDITGKDIFK